jgi:hypothetical protein
MVPPMSTAVSSSICSMVETSFKSSPSSTIGRWRYWWYFRSSWYSLKCLGRLGQALWMFQVVRPLLKPSFAVAH